MKALVSPVPSSSPSPPPCVTVDDADETGAAGDDGDDDLQTSKVMSFGSCGNN